MTLAFQMESRVRCHLTPKAASQPPHSRTCGGSDDFHQSLLFLRSLHAKSRPLQRFNTLTLQRQFFPFDLSQKFGVADRMKMFALFGRMQFSRETLAIVSKPVEQAFQPVRFLWKIAPDWTGKMPVPLVLQRFSRGFRFAILLSAAVVVISLAGCASPHDIVDEAVKDNDVQKVTSMVESDPSLVSSQDKGGDTLLHWAAARGYESLAELLINDKADVNAQNIEGDTPLYLAAGNGHSDIIELLLMHGAQADARDKGGATPLDKAAQYDRPRQVELLLARGADIAAKDKNGDTPLHYAAMSGSGECVQILLDHGAAVNAENQDGLTPLHQAVLNGHTSVALLLSQHGGHE